MDTRTFDHYDNQTYVRFISPAIIEKNLQTLVGIIEGIQGDGVINVMEHEELRDWINANKQYENKQPYAEIIGLIREAVADNVLTKDESDNIIWFCNQYLQKNGYFDAITGGLQKLMGIVRGII